MTQDLNVILRQVAESDPEAFRKLFELYAGKVHGFAFKLTHSTSTSEEIVQEVFLKVWINRKALVSVTYFPAYVFAITRNQTLNVLKRMALEERVKRKFTEDLKDTHCETEESVIYGDYNRMLKQAIDDLPPQQRIVYSLCHGEGLKYEEVAQRLRISRLTVKTHMQHAMRSIKSHFRLLIRILPPLLLCSLSL